jgi:N-glycosylase/DNA lyase
MAAVLKEALAQMPLSSDSVLANAVAGCPGLIILRQPLEETLLAFLLSSNKRIPQIRQMCEALAFRHGALLAHGLHALPTWETLASVSKDALRRCSLGFRARHVHGTARFLAAHPGWLDRVRSAPYSDAHALLLELPGVGDKIADCVLLFAGGKPEAFPVDVWILRALENNYGLHGWKPAQLAQFGRVHFGPFAGLAQQHLFAAERRRR